MNIDAIRTDLADAVSAVTGVKVSARYTPTLKPGDGMVRFDNAVRDVTGFGWIVTVQCLIALPQTIADAERWIDDNAGAVVDAAASAVVVVEVAPVQLQLDTGLVPALQITGTRAA